MVLYVTLDHKTSDNGNIKLFDFMESKGSTNQNIEKITFKVVQIKFLAMQITNKKQVFIYLWKDIYKT